MSTWLLLLFHFSFAQTPVSPTTLDANLSAPLLDIAHQITGLESIQEGLKAGQEKHFQWSQPEAPVVTEHSFIYLHGFSASRKEVSPLLENLASQMKSNAFWTRLTGHGLNDPDALGNSYRENWEKDIAEAIDIGRQIGKKVIVVATSTSAALAFSYIQKHPDDIIALVAISPNFGFDRLDSELLLWPLARVWVPWVMGSYREFIPTNSAQAQAWTTRYPYQSLVEVMRSVDLLRKTDLSKFPVPVLGFYSEKDQVVDPKKIKEGFRRLNSPNKKLIEIKNAKDSHILAGDILSPSSTETVTSEILSFVKNLK